MAVKLGSLAANLRRENDGDWIDIPDLPGVSLKVRGGAYGPFQAAKSIVDQRFARKWLAKGDPVPQDIAYKENGKLYADHILLGWAGFDEEFSPGRAYEALTDPAMRAMHDHVRYAMTRVAETEAEFVEDAGKNSLRSSAGGSKVPA